MFATDQYVFVVFEGCSVFVKQFICDNVILTERKSASVIVCLRIANDMPFLFVMQMFIIVLEPLCIIYSV